MTKKHVRSYKPYIFSGIIIILLISLFFINRLSFHPTVSVVMPVYNREDLVSRAIESILSQTFTDYEFIIVDDGSTDNTSKILNDYSKLDKRIKVIRNETNRGIPFSRNRGMKAARGTYIAIMDSDDYSLPDRLAKSVHFLKDHPEVDAVSANLRIIQPDMTIFPTPETNMPNDEYKIQHMPGYYEVDLLFYNNFYNIASMFKRSFVQKHNITYRYDYIAAEDYYFWFQFVKNGGKLASLSDAVAYMRFHATNGQQYYTAIETNSTNLHKEAFSMFFTPNKEEIQFEYTVFEKCPILKKMIAGNAEKHVFPEEYLENYFALNCPSGKDYFMLVHPNWQAFIEKEKDGRYRRIGTDIYAKINQISPNEIMVLWENYAPEKFIIKNDKQQYYYMPHDRKVKLIHPAWTDTLWMNKNYPVACRETTFDCANFTFANDDKDLTIEWRYWPKEEFVKIDKDTYKYKEEGAEKEQVKEPKKVLKKKKK